MRLSFVRHFNWASIVTAFFLAFAISCAAQDTRAPTPLHEHDAAQNTDETTLTPQQQKDMEKNVRLQRQREIEKETDKLLQLATELKLSVDKADANTLSLDVIKKAEQIEKLAKSVKEKMKGQ